MNLKKEMMTIDTKIIMFDLDGTLSDPKEGITKSVQYALEKMDIFEPDLDKLESFIGPPLQESFAEKYSFNLEKSQKAIDYFRERFQEKGMFENNLYFHIPQLLNRLKEKHKQLIVATSKPTVFAEKILAHFHIDHYFDHIVGSNLDGTRINKTDIIQHVLNLYEQNQQDDFIMIGDRKYDIAGAKNTGIRSIGVTYGYGSIPEIEQSEPTYIAHQVTDIEKFLLR